MLLVHIRVKLVIRRNTRISAMGNQIEKKECNILLMQIIYLDLPSCTLFVYIRQYKHLLIYFLL